MSHYDPNVNESGYIYSKWKVNENTYFIGYRSIYAYLLIGEERALLFDTFYGHGNLRYFA